MLEFVRVCHRALVRCLYGTVLHQFNLNLKIPRSSNRYQRSQTCKRPLVRVYSSATHLLITSCSLSSSWSSSRGPCLLAPSSPCQSPLSHSAPLILQSNSLALRAELKVTDASLQLTDRCGMLQDTNCWSFRSTLFDYSWLCQSVSRITGLNWVKLLRMQWACSWKTIFETFARSPVELLLRKEQVI